MKTLNWEKRFSLFINSFHSCLHSSKKVGRCDEKRRTLSVRGGEECDEKRKLLDVRCRGGCDEKRMV